MIKFWVNIIKVYFFFLISLKYTSLFEKKKSSKCMSIPISQFIPPAFPVLVPMCSLCLCLCICFANQIKNGHFQSDKVVSSSDRQILQMEKLYVKQN